jgi:hypothetical protein
MDGGRSTPGSDAGYDLIVLDAEDLGTEAEEPSFGRG